MSEFEDLKERLDATFKKEKEVMKELVSLHREMLKFYGEHAPPEKKREREEEPAPEPSDGWKCVGLVMEDKPCPGNYKKPKELERVQIKHDGHLRPCCRGCKNARDRFNNRQKKKQKKEEETN